MQAQADGLLILYDAAQQAFSRLVVIIATPLERLDIIVQARKPDSERVELLAREVWHRIGQHDTVRAPGLGQTAAEGRHIVGRRRHQRRRRRDGDRHLVEKEHIEERPVRAILPGIDGLDRRQRAQHITEAAARVLGGEVDGLRPQIQVADLLERQHREQRAPLADDAVMQPGDELAARRILRVEKRHLEKERPCPDIRNRVDMADILDRATDGQTLDERVEKIEMLLLPDAGLIRIDRRVFLELRQEREKLFCHVAKPPYSLQQSYSARRKRPNP